MSNVKDIMVPWLKGIKPCFPKHIDMAWENKKLVRMMSNEGPFEPRKVILDELIEGAKAANRYPSSLNHIKKKIGEINFGLNSDCILFGNGSTEVLDMIFRSFLQPGDELIQSIPCYGSYAKQASALGAKTISILAKDNWKYDVDEIEKAISPKTKIVILANPNNPTGNLMKDVVCDRLAQKNIIFICDEAYIEYSGLKNSKTHLMMKYPNMIIVRSLSKAYGLAGVRFGYALGCPEIIEIVSRVTMLYNVNVVSAFGAYAALSDQKGLEKEISFINKEKDYIERELSKIYNLVIYQTYGNFILIDASSTGITSEEIVSSIMNDHGILLRNIAAFKGRKGLFRITIGNKKENKKCVSAIKEFFKSKER